MFLEIHKQKLSTVKKGRDAPDHKLDHIKEAINEVDKDYNQIR
jgi:hypothetical protein